MYIPPSFREDDPAVLHELMRRHNFATLVTVVDGAPYATHLPFLLDAGRGEHGTLVAHMARANPQWRSFDGQAEALTVFLGPHTYVSPAWYAAPEVVPTWNYAAVHVYGVPRIIDDPAVLRGWIERLVRFHEGPGAELRDGNRAGREVNSLLRAVVGFEIPIRRIEGKLKFNQNRSRADQAGVVAALEREADPQLRGVVEIMRRNLGPNE